MADSTGKAVAELRYAAFNFLLQPEFPMNALILASEALRIANQNSGRELFRWRLVSESGDPSPSQQRHVDRRRQRPGQHARRGRLSALRRQSADPDATRRSFWPSCAPWRATAPRSARSTPAPSPWPRPAWSGGRPSVLHWEAVPTFKERFPDSEVRQQLFLIEGNQVHCAGGVATLDLMLELIGRSQGAVLANEVANALVHRPRPAQAPQRLDEPAERAGAALPDRIIEQMERNLDFPLTLKQLAEDLEISPRGLARACARHFDESPMRLYLRIRLQAARNFLFYEEFSIKDVALACGFSYPTVFARAFKSQFGETPRAFRSKWRRKQSQTYLPEIRRLSFSRRELGAGSR